MLYIVSTPIGNPKDISLRALETLKSCDGIIVEERKAGVQQLRSLKIPVDAPALRLLNEHTTKEDLLELLHLCKDKKMAYICDGGTPGFSDPGSSLVALCRKEKIRIHAVPGACSLTTLLSLSSRKISSFVFEGFLPQKSPFRENRWKQLQKEERNWIGMDTPYRFQKVLQELTLYFPNRFILLGMNLTVNTESSDSCILESSDSATEPPSEFTSEMVWEGLGSEIPRFKENFPQKSEFIFLLYGKVNS